MPLGLQTESGGGDFADVVKFDARAGRWFRVDRSQDSAGNWATDSVDITHSFQAVFDLANVEVGWVFFANGLAPQWAMVPLGQALPPKPTDQHKQAFRMQLLLGKTAGGDVREFASQAKAVIGAVDKLYDAYAADPESKQGLLPVVAMTSSTPIKSSGGGQTSTNYAPVFEITAWVKRPDRLDGGAGNAPADKGPTGGAGPGAQQEANYTAYAQQDAKHQADQARSAIPAGAEF